MKEIPIYNVDGTVADMLVLPEDVEFISGRTSKAQSCYYKGVGARYKKHASLKKEPYRVIGKNPVFYYGYDVENVNWAGKFGIFRERFQPYFSDFIGSCGPKESSLEEKTILFSCSAVEVLDKVEFDLENKQSYYRLNYTSPRDSFLDGGEAADFVNLMECMLTEGWNFPWDKAAVRDINKCGKVTDVADVFFSHNIIHKFGTIYSVLFSIFQLHPEMYTKLINQLGFKSNSIEGIPFIIYLFMHKLGLDLPMKENLTDKKALYIHLIGNILLRGRNCASVENIEEGNNVMLKYVDRFKATLNDSHKRIIAV